MKRGVTVSVLGAAVSIIGLSQDDAMSFVAMMAARSTREPKPSAARVADFADHIASASGYTVSARSPW